MTIYGNIAASMIKAGDEIFVLNSLTKHIEIKKVEKIVKDYRSENKVYNLKLKGENYIVDGVVVMMK